MRPAACWAAVWHLFPVLRSASQAVSPASARRSLTRPANVLAAGVPGLTKSWPDFADALGCAPEQVLYYGMTWLTPRCSHLALLPSMTASGHPMTARNYEFNDEAEDFTVIKPASRENIRI